MNGILIARFPNLAYLQTGHPVVDDQEDWFFG